MEIRTKRIDTIRQNYWFLKEGEVLRADAEITSVCISRSRKKMMEN